MLIIILNFLIAEVSMTYDKVKSSGMQFLYQKKSEVNKNAYVYKELFKKIFDGKDNEFTVLVFKTPRDISDLSGVDDMFGFTSTVKNEIKKLLATAKVDLLKYSKRMQDLIEGIKK